MKWLQRHWRAIVRIIAVLLIFVSVGASYFWFYLVMPLRHQLDNHWCRQHSTEAFWNEVETGSKRFVWFHDYGSWAGQYGDAEFMAWAMEHTKPGDDIGSCFAGHRDMCFRGITNQNPGETACAWLDWWGKNKSKSQVQWIRDGFMAQGVNVSIPPAESDTIPLLTLLGNIDTKADEEESPEVSWYIKYNVFRWLRDSDFNPVDFAISSDVDGLDEKIKVALREYLKFERNYPKKERVGILSLGKEGKEDLSCEYEITSLHSKAIFYALSFGPLCLGLLLILWTFKKPRSSVS